MKYSAMEGLKNVGQNFGLNLDQKKFLGGGGPWNFTLSSNFENQINNQYQSI
jgi:hypothetical protein